MLCSSLRLSASSVCKFTARAFATSSPEGIIDKDFLKRAINKKPNKHYHILSTRVRF